MRVLLTNITLATRSGTEVNIRDTALGLLRRGHRPVVYSPELGPMAEEIRAATVPVVDDLAAVAAAPDVIHGHHHPPTLTALLRFPGVPAVYFVHDWNSWYDEPPVFPRVTLYAPVDETNADRLELEHGIDRGRLRVLFNAVDLERCHPRPPLPARPRRALVLSNTASESGCLRAIRLACERAGIELAVVGACVGRPSDRPEDLLAEADLVFARARSALEAMAIGTAVILCDQQGLGEMVTSDAVERMRPRNFGVRLLQRAVTAEGVLAEIERYDAVDAARVSAWVRRQASLEPALDRLVAVYEEAIALGRALVVDPAEEGRAVAAYLQRWSPRFRDHGAALVLERLRPEVERAHRAAAQEAALRMEADQRLAAAVAAAAGNEAARQQAEEVATARALAVDRVAASEQALRTEIEGHLAAARAEVSELRRELAWVTSTATWRWRGRLLRSAPLHAAYRLLRRLFRQRSASPASRAPN